MRGIIFLVGLGILTGSLLPQSIQTSFPTDPGMYVTTERGISKIVGQIVTFKRTGSLAVSGLTGGIKTRKENVQLLGAHAQTVTDSMPVFYFIPAKHEADTGVNAGDLVLVRLEEKAKRRQFEIGAQGLWRASSGISLTHQVQIYRAEEKLGVYKVIPSNSLKKGEYALYVARGNGLTPYVYDFSVERENEGLDPTFQPKILVRDESVTNVNPASQGAASSLPPPKTVPTPRSDWPVAKSGDSSTAERSSSKMPAGTESVVIDSATGDYDAELSIGASFHGNLVARHDGVEVSVVQKGGVLDEIGVKAGDFIVALDDHYVFTIQELHNELRAHPLDTRVAIRYRRRTLIYDTFIMIGPG